MKIDLELLKQVCSERDMSLSAMLESAGVSRNAFYSLARRESILPGSIRAIAEYLQIPPSEFLIEEVSGAQPDRALLKQIEEIALRHPDANKNTIRNTLILLREEPVERLKRALQSTESTMSTDREIAFLGELNRAGVEFMIVGLSASTLQGASVGARQVELWFRDLSDPGLKQSLRTVFGTFIPPSGENPPRFAGEAVKLFAIVTYVAGLSSFEEEYDRTVKVRLGRFKVRVLPLERIIVNKEALFQEEDRLVLPILKDALAVISEPGQVA